MLRRRIRRPRIHRDDRLLLLILDRLCRRWRDALHLVNPQTPLRWHWDLFKLIRKRRSRPRDQPMRLSPEVTLIRAMAKDSALWGAERIRGEFLKLSVRVSKRVIQMHMMHARPSGSSTTSSSVLSSRSSSWSTAHGESSIST
jgi:putative transposase